MTSGLRAITSEQLRQFETEGYLIVKGLYQPEHLTEIETTLEQISHRTIPDYFEPDFTATDDPLKRYPRVKRPHRFDQTSKKYMLHPPVLDVLRDLFGEEPLGCSSLFFFKPPGARGQALHQDNFYLLAEPGTSIAAWMAIDAADEENGAMMVVPQTNNYDIVCPDEADEKESFTMHYVKPPKDRKPIPAIMDKGDVLFFNGNLIHGSYRNRSKDRFRRSFICHYVNASATHISKYYNPVIRADGAEIALELNGDGGPCGIAFPKIAESPYV
jgi:ectoine hydroxylase-related dioxygenase (phytanoyl-CoA dioxygenase family)